MNEQNEMYETYGSIDLNQDGLSIVVSLDKQNVFKVGNISFMTQEESELFEWSKGIQEVIELKHRSYKEKRSLKIAPELNDLVVYCRTIQFNGRKSNDVPLGILYSTRFS